VIKLLDVVALRRDFPQLGLSKGDLGTVVEKYGASAFEVEFVRASGHTLSVVELTSDDVRQVGDHDIISVRELRRSA